jgi:hypothetical protein
MSTAARLAELLEQTAPPPEVEVRHLPVPDALTTLLSDGLRCGTAVEAPDPHLLLALAGAAAPLDWHAAIGLPEIHWAAGEPYGLRLEQLLLVDGPGPRWPDVVATLIPDVATILLGPVPRPEPRVTKRLAALLRRHGTVLISAGMWPGSALRLGVSEPQWSGLGSGHGLLAGREVTITVTGRGGITQARSARVWLPDGRGELCAVDTAGATLDLAAAI